MNEADIGLVRRALWGDQNAFGELVRTYQGTVVSQAVGKVPRFDDAEDIAQKAFIRAYLNLHTLRDPSKFLPWLRTIVSNLCFQWTAQEKRGDVPEGVFGEAFGGHALPIPDEAYAQEELRAYVERVFTAMPPEIREPMALRWFEGCTYREIAERLGVSETTVRGRLARGREHLKVELADLAEEVFRDRRPKDPFTSRVMGALPALSIGNWLRRILALWNIKWIGAWGMAVLLATVVALVGGTSYLLWSRSTSESSSREHASFHIRLTPEILEVEHAASTAPDGPMQLVGHWAGPLSRDIQVFGNYAYVAAMESGLRVIDVSDPAYPVEVGHWEANARVYGLWVDGQHAYVANSKYHPTHSKYPGDLALWIVDLSDPISPRSLGYLHAWDTLMDVVVSGRYAYLANQDAGLRIVDVGRPNHPREVAFIEGYAHCIKLHDHYAYVSSALGDLRVVDIRDPQQPQVMNTMSVGKWLAGLDISGQYLYVAAGPEGFRILDISDPVQPVQVAAYDTPGSAQDVLVDRESVYVADAGAGVRVVDISDVTNPKEADHFGGSALSLSVEGRYVYVAGKEGVYILQKRSPELAVSSL